MTDLIAPLGAFPQSGHALQQRLIFGAHVVLTEGVRRAGWDARQHVQSLIFGTVNATEPICDPAEFYSRPPTRSPLTRTRRAGHTEHFALRQENLRERWIFSGF